MLKRLVKIFLLCTLVFNTTNAQIQKQPNIVWITSEDNSVHYMKLYDDGGVKTPNIESLAEQGLVFNHAFSNAPVCSAARSTLISGVYGPSLASHYHRHQAKVPMPDGLKMFPAYLKEGGYYTTNNSKEDYNIFKTEDVWDNSSPKATWRNRAEGQPFFHVQNYGVTHEASLHFSQEEFEGIPTAFPLEDVKIQPNHPQTELFRYTNARYRDHIATLDEKIGQLLKKLEEDNLMDDTFIFYFGDHGGVLPGSKGYLYETGLHVPMVVYVPKNFRHLVDFNEGSRVDGFVSFIDLAPTVLKLAGIMLPEVLHGHPFLGEGVKGAEVDKRDVTYSYADRFDEKYDMVRAVRKGKYKYIRNYQPFNVDALFNQYRYKQLGYQEWQQHFIEGKLDAAQAAFFKARPAEMLFDVEADPFETNNLAILPEYKSELEAMRTLLGQFEKENNDLSFYPEYFLVDNAFDNPMAYGQAHKADIEALRKVADLALLSPEKVSTELKKALMSDDEWKRYWALIVCSSFRTIDEELLPVVKKLLESDKVFINRVRAAECLAICKSEKPQKAMLNALYQSENKAEALLMLNSMALMSMEPYNHQFNIETEKLKVKIDGQGSEILNRINFLNGNSVD